MKTKLTLILLLWSFSSSYAHEDLLIRIKDKSEEIDKNPNNSKLYLERGYLYQQHEEFLKAVTDYYKSEELGNDSKLLHYRKAESFYGARDHKNALKSIEICLERDRKDIKFFKLKAHVLSQVKRHNEALELYQYVIKNTLDIRPEDFVMYSRIFLSIDSTDYKRAVEAIDLGLEKLGSNIFSLHSKKIEYLKESNQQEEVLKGYNYLILHSKRKEFLYYKKAEYLAEINKKNDSSLALHQAKVSIIELKPKLKNTVAIKRLITQISDLEKNLNTHKTN